MIWFEPFIELAGTSLSTIRLFDALQTAQDHAAKLRVATIADRAGSELAMALCRVGQLAITLGIGKVAETALTEASALAPLPEIQLGLGWAQRLTGQYQVASESFEQARQAIANGSAPADLGLMYCARDSGHWVTALDTVELVISQLNQEQAAHYGIMARFLKAELCVRSGRDTDAHSTLDQLDVELTSAKLAWFRPEWWALRARLALARGDARAAEKSSRLGLGAVDDRGDGQQLTVLYRTLAGALERDRSGSGIDDARDARHRSLVAAQNRGPQIEIARALFEIGLHYKLFANLPTRRARGSGYLYEADKLYQSMGIAMPSTDETNVPLL